jgi:hypothetical protein
MPRFTKRMTKRSNRRSRSKKVITRRKKNRFTRKYGVKNGVKYGGAASTSSVPGVKLPMIIDQNQVSYTCTPVPTS